VNTIPKLVFSSTLDATPWGQWEPAQVMRGDPTTEVARLKQAPGAGLMVWGSLSLAQALLQASLVDEIQLRTLPIALGTGRRLFPGGVGLRLIEAEPYRSGIVSLTYRPAT
jgi:dihydrofolate reductase